MSVWATYYRYHRGVSRNCRYICHNQKDYCTHRSQTWTCILGKTRYIDSSLSFSCQNRIDGALLSPFTKASRTFQSDKHTDRGVCLTYKRRDEMFEILQTFSTLYSCMKIIVVSLDNGLAPIRQQTIHYMKQGWLSSLTHTCVTLSSLTHTCVTLSSLTHTCVKRRR